jgi:hypothetical protein
MYALEAPPLNFLPQCLHSSCLLPVEEQSSDDVT